MNHYFQWKGIWDYSDVLLSPLLGIEDRACNLAVQVLLAYLVLFLFNSTSLASNRGVVLDCPETHEARNQDLFVLDFLVRTIRCFIMFYLPEFGQTKDHDLLKMKWKCFHSKHYLFVTFLGPSLSQTPWPLRFKSFLHRRAFTTSGVIDQIKTF